VSRHIERLQNCPGSLRIGNAGDDWFYAGTPRYEIGNTDYSGSGTQCCNPDWYYELRGRLAEISIDNCRASGDEP